MAKHSISGENKLSADAIKEQKTLLTVTMATLLKPQKEHGLVKVYAECFMMLTEHHF